MLDSYKQENYYTVAQVAELLGVTKQTINNRCKNGNYDGAFKTEPNRDIGDPHGMWLVPRICIDTPHIIQDVATLTRQINPAELQRVIVDSVNQAVTAAVEPLTQKLDDQAILIQQQNKLIEDLRLENSKNIQTITNVIADGNNENREKLQEIAFQVGELSRAKRPKPGFWKSLFGD